MNYYSLYLNVQLKVKIHKQMPLDITNTSIVIPNFAQAWLDCSKYYLLLTQYYGHYLLSTCIDSQVFDVWIFQTWQSVYNVSCQTCQCQAHTDDQLATEWHLSQTFPEELSVHLDNHLVRMFSTQCSVLLLKFHDGSPS